VRRFAPLIVIGLLAPGPSGVASGDPAGTARLIPIADAAWAGSSVNVVANIRQSVYTHERTQFAAYYDADRFMVLARRSLDADRWETRRTAYQGNAANAHNSISLVVDGAGVLHVAWDHHVNPLNYARGVAPGSIELGPRQPMTGQLEGRVTYPQFFRLPGGDLLFLYRDGASGRGSLVLNRYAVATGAWATVQNNLIDGEGERSPYWDMTIDRRGTLHLAWVWRESPDVATNHDICYMRSADEGRTWSGSNGSRVAIPVTARTAEYAARIPQNSNLMNSPAITADDEGRPYVTTYWSPSPGAPPRFHVVHHEGTGWRIIEGPARSDVFTLSGGGTKAPPISRAVVLVERAGQASRLHLIHRDSGTAGRGRVTAATLERPGAGTWTVQDLTVESVGAWEPAIDPAAWAGLRQVHMLVQRVTQRDGDDRTGVAAPTPIGLLVWSPSAGRER
jgi:hypothetical protein